MYNGSNYVPQASTVTNEHSILNWDLSVQIIQALLKQASNDKCFHVNVFQVRILINFYVFQAMNTEAI